MATGACGINCDVCRLNLLEMCTTCGSGKSEEARIKLAIQKRTFGDTCPILSCAVMNNIAYCMRDCSQFPCDNFSQKPYPFSSGYLEMQRRRRKEWMPRVNPLGRPVDIPDEYWDTLEKKDINLVRCLTMAKTDGEGRLLFNFLDLNLRLDPFGKLVEKQQDDGSYLPLDIPLLTLTVLIYFMTVDRLFPMGTDLISTQDMEDRGKYFMGDHELKTEHILSRFAHDTQGVDQAVLALGGSKVKMGDAGWVLYPFPRVAVYYLFWDMESEYDTRLSILFDRSIREIFSPPMVWELVNLVNARLLSA